MSVTELLVKQTNQEPESDFDKKLREHKEQILLKNIPSKVRLSRIYILYKILHALEYENLPKHKINRCAVNQTNRNGWNEYQHVFTMSIQKGLIEEIIIHKRAPKLNNKIRRDERYFKITHEGKIRLNQMQEILDILELKQVKNKNLNLN